MDIVTFWKDQITKWNTEEKCGFCWNFDAPLFLSHINMIQLEQEKSCCVNVFLTDLTYREQETTNTVTALVTNKFCEYGFVLYVCFPKDIAGNNYNEIKGHDILNSNYHTVYKPILDCFGCGNILDFCEILGYKPAITSKSATTFQKLQGNNYSGWRIPFTFRINNVD